MPIDLIPPSEIQSELTRIWDSLEGTNKMRASLFNLIFFTKKKPRAEYIRVICQNVIAKFPSRVIFITADTEVAQDYLHTGVSVLPSTQGEYDIACDYIQIDVAGKYQERVPFILLPHLLPDLPIYVIWAEDPAEESPLLAQLQKLANRFIFDSEAIVDLARFAQNLLQFKTRFQCDVADLNWARMESWRDLLTSTFYTQEKLLELKKTEKINISYNAQESQFYCHTQTQAIYLQGWLGTQLDWKLIKMSSEKGKMTFFYQKNEQKSVEISLSPEWQPTMKAGTILSFDLQTEDKHHFSLARDGKLPHQVTLNYSTLKKCDRPLKYLLAKDESGQSLVKEICHKGTSRHYLNLLDHIKNRKEFSFCE